MEPIARRGKRSNTSERSARRSATGRSVYWGLVDQRVCIAVFGPPAKGRPGLRTDDVAMWLGKATIGAEQCATQPSGKVRRPPCCRMFSMRVHDGSGQARARDAQSVPTETEPCSHHRGAAECHPAHHPMSPHMPLMHGMGASRTCGAGVVGFSAGTSHAPRPRPNSSHYRRVWGLCFGFSSALGPCKSARALSATLNPNATFPPHRQHENRQVWHKES